VIQEKYKEFALCYITELLRYQIKINSSFIINCKYMGYVSKSKVI
jgi:hypothetical protein